MHSRGRILTTHVGSLPRPRRLIDLFRLMEGGGPFDEADYRELCRRAVADIVHEQVAHGVDIVNDGEMGKASFISYVQYRLGGFDVQTSGPGVEGAGGGGRLASRETLSFPEFYEAMARLNDAGGTVGLVQMECVAPVVYKGQALIQADIANLKQATAGARVEDVFLPAIAPSDVEGRYRNRYYPTDEAYLFAIAEAMREEYRAIIDAGFILQIDDPLLLTYYVKHPELSVAECRRWAEVRIEALNHGLRGLPVERIRYHTCYGINMGPRVHDMELKSVVDLILRINAGGYSFEAGNPRHEHEWRVWETAGLPEDKVLIPGIISHTTHLVEHPEAVADRITRFADVVGRDRVIAGTDCGFATFASSTEIHGSIVWAKFDALREGARLASERLWRRNPKRIEGASALHK
ncbi:MAG: cobalamin-independent methionine synthase II family protein [Geminicoccaceae bacterium]